MLSAMQFKYSWWLSWSFFHLDGHIRDGVIYFLEGFGLDIVLYLLMLSV